MNFVRRMTAGLGIVRRSDRTTRSESASTISALPSITSRSARRIGTIVSGSYDAFRARQPSTTKLSLPLFEDRHTNSPSTAAGEPRQAIDGGAPKPGLRAQLHVPEGSTASYADASDATRSNPNR